MPANLPAEAKAKWAQVCSLRSAPEKIKLMREFFRLFPSIKEQISSWQYQTPHRGARTEIEKTRATQKGGGRQSGFSIPKEGAGQVIVLGPNESWKKQSPISVTNAKPEISPLPFTTQKPTPGMLHTKMCSFSLLILLLWLKAHLKARWVFPSHRLGEERRRLIFDG